MNILFYVNPLTEIQKPRQKTTWINGWIQRFTKALDIPGEKIHITAVVSSDVYAFLDDPAAYPVDAWCVLSQRDLLDDYRYDGTMEMRNWLEGNEDTEYTRYMARLLKERLPADCRPDYIITFCPAPFFEKIFGGTPVLYHEYGCFSRPPYPETFYLDPWGKGPCSFNSRYSDLINDIPASQEDIDKLREYRERIIDCLKSVPEVASFFEKLHERFRTIFLLPLGYSNFYETEAFSKYSTQFEFVEHVLDSISDDIGVLLTQHPVCPSVRDDSLEDLKRLHPNLITDEISYQVNGFSQIALAYVDGLITHSSSLGLQAAFLNKYFVSVGSFFSGLADCTSLDGFGEMIRKKVMNRDNFFVWNLTCYTIPGNLFSELIPDHIKMVSELRGLPPREALKQWKRFPRDVFEESYLPHVREMAGEFHPAIKTEMSALRMEYLIIDLKEQLRNAKGQIAILNAKCDYLQQRYDEFQMVLHSVSYLTGRIITWPLRMVRNGLRGLGKKDSVCSCDQDDRKDLAEKKGESGSV